MSISKSLIQELQRYLSSSANAPKAVSKTAEALSAVGVKSISDTGICQIPADAFSRVVSAAEGEGILLTVIATNSGCKAGEKEAFNVSLSQLNEQKAVVKDAVDEVEISMAIASVLMRRS
jgi:hypothetical protein